MRRRCAGDRRSRAGSARRSRRPSVTICRRPDRCRAPRRRPTSTTRASPAVGSISITDGVLDGFLQNAYTARASGTVSTGSAQRGSHRSAPGVGPRVVKLRCRHAQSPEAGHGRGRRRAVGDRARRAALRGEPGVGRSVGRHRGSPDPWRRRWPSPSARSRSGRRCSGCWPTSSRSVATSTYFPWEATGVTLAIADVTMSGS